MGLFTVTILFFAATVTIQRAHQRLLLVRHGHFETQARHLSYGRLAWAIHQLATDATFEANHLGQSNAFRYSGPDHTALVWLDQVSTTRVWLRCQIELPGQAAFTGNYLLKKQPAGFATTYALDKHDSNPDSLYRKVGTNNWEPIPPPPKLKWKIQGGVPVRNDQATELAADIKGVSADHQGNLNVVWKREDKPDMVLRCSGSNSWSLLPALPLVGWDSSGGSRALPDLPQDVTDLSSGSGGDQLAVLARQANQGDAIYSLTAGGSSFVLLPPVPNVGEGGFAVQSPDDPDLGVQDIAMDGQRRTFALNRLPGSRREEILMHEDTDAAGGGWRSLPRPAISPGDSSAPSVGELSVDEDGHVLATTKLDGVQSVYRFIPGQDTGGPTVAGFWLKLTMPGSVDSSWLATDSAGSVLGLFLPPGLTPEIQRYSFSKKTWSRLADITETMWTADSSGTPLPTTGGTVNHLNEIAGGGTPKNNGMYDYQVLNSY